MNWIKRLTNFIKSFSKSNLEVVYVKTGLWNITDKDGKVYENKHCDFQILFNKVTKEYSLLMFGHLPKAHAMYVTIFKVYRKLQEGTLLVKGGELYENPKSYKSNDILSLDLLTEDECHDYLDEALDRKDYKLVDLIKKRLDDFNK